MENLKQVYTCKVFRSIIKCFVLNIKKKKEKDITSLNNISSEHYNFFLSTIKYEV